jgi:hypothetical protein
MTRTLAKLLLWGPRTLGIAVALFLAMFALDAFGEAKPLSRALVDFAIHLLPAAVLLSVVAASWRREWVGGVGFIGLAVAYVFVARGRADWILVISGPLLTVGLLFLWSWWYRDRERSRHPAP